MSDLQDRLLLNGSKRYSSQWSRIQSAWLSNRIPQAMLFVGPFNYDFNDFVRRLTQLFFCKIKNDDPCFECNDCLMVTQGEHPDVAWIKPEKNGGPIKIDQIRELQTDVYLTPQRSKYRLVVIESADRMNIAAANSLLKILEEPAQQTIFLLLAQQLSTLLPTVLSRCQILRFNQYHDSSITNLLQLANESVESEKVMVVKESDLILNGLIAVLEQREHPSRIVSQWSNFELSGLIWFLYLIYAQVQVLLLNKFAASDPSLPQLNTLKSLISPLKIYSQIDKINTLKRKLSHNMNVNPTLALEDLLLELYSKSKGCP